MNVFNIANTYRVKKERGWDRLYWAIDLHDTIFKGKYDSFQTVELYPGAAEVLKFLTDREDHILIAYTSTDIGTYLRISDHLQFWHGIRFNYLNQNPEYEKTDYADFSIKFYYNILLEDKAGFEGEKDWFLVKQELINVGDWIIHNK